MATLVTFHAHPDDESILMGGAMRMAHDDGHRVVLVIATMGELGETPDGVEQGESLAKLRVRETQAAAEALGVDRIEFLGYLDSGMADTPDNDAPGAFWSADVEEAAARLAAILIEEDADVLTIYDDNGGYGHPDHIQVHRVGRRAAELADTPTVYQATSSQENVRRGMELAVLAGAMSADDLPPEDFEIGKPEAEITTFVDVTAYLAVKREAMRAHASQISEDSFFLGIPEDAFAFTFGTEWFIREGAEPGSETAII